MLPGLWWRLAAHAVATAGHGRRGPEARQPRPAGASCVGSHEAAYRSRLHASHSTRRRPGRHGPEARAAEGRRWVLWLAGVRLRQPDRLAGMAATAAQAGGLAAEWQA